mgnify:CR=1 FL=1
MSRIIKRVPLDFKYEGVWKGYLPTIKELQSIPEVVKAVPEILTFDNNSYSICSECDKIFNDCNEDARYCLAHNEDLKKLWHHEPPTGEGYQLWETTTEGSSQSPVFNSLEELCAWAEDNATIWSDYKISKEEWFKIFTIDGYTVRFEH